jgi:hypothetical protein
MSALLPSEYVTIRAAAATLAKAMFAGEPESAEIIALRAKHGLRVRDGRDQRQALEIIWTAIDRGEMKLIASGGIPARLVTVPASLANEIPFLRRICTLHYLRPHDPRFSQFAAVFGSNLSRVALTVRQSELRRLIKNVLRSRRRAETQPGQRGRPSIEPRVMPAIREVIAKGKWKPTQSIKQLTLLVNRTMKASKDVSEDTVGRTLDRLQDETGDRRYSRVKRTASDKPPLRNARRHQEAKLPVPATN